MSIPAPCVTLLLDTLVGGAMMHALSTPADKRADLARNTGPHATRRVEFLLRRDSRPASGRRAFAGDQAGIDSRRR